MHSDDIIFENLNDAQKQAVTTFAGPLLIIAGPGTGKTLTIIRRIAYLIQQGIQPQNILAITFTNRAAREMKERAESLLGAKAGHLFLGTFHLLGLKIIQEVNGVNFSLIDRDEQIELVKSLMKGSLRNAQQMVEHISRVKNFLESTNTETNDIYNAYQNALKERNSYDFDDLIRVPIELLEQNSDQRKKYQDRFQYIIVDEYQDINPAQYRLIKLLAGDSANICVVGDADQAIYAFRGADINHYLNFEKDFPNVIRITLAEHYRSTSTILNSAESVIKNNKKRIERELVCMQSKGVPLITISAPDERGEAAAIIQSIEERIGGTSHSRMRQGTMRDEPEQSYRFSDFAIVFRTNAQVKALEEEFKTSGIPYQIIGRKISSQVKEIEETRNYLQSLIRSDSSEDILAEGNEEKLLSQADFFDPSADAVTLATFHMAKGLEFRIVFITGCEEGLVPYTLMKEKSDIEEERRLFYVGMTRAKEELILSYARNRFIYGQRPSLAPTPFLSEIPQEHIQNIVIPDKKKKQKEPEQQMGLF
ncbi:MAG: UvrD-helicase domain-containing protein [Nitrospirota bacterium]